MDWSKTPPFGAIKQRLDWLDQRQQVLARNIANADTPGFTPSDLKPFSFGDQMRRQTVAMAATAPSHLHGTGAQAAPFAERRDRKPVEALPNGNAVDLEEQMAKVAETGTTHRLATQLYRKYLGMIRSAASVRG